MKTVFADLPTLTVLVAAVAVFPSYQRSRKSLKYSLPEDFPRITFTVLLTSLYLG